MVLSPELIQRFCEVLRRGNFVHVAAALVGVTKKTVYDWLKVARRTRATVNNGGLLTNHQKYCCSFAAAMKQAMAEAEATAVGHVVDAAKDEWRAAAWMLSRRWGARWRDRSRDDPEAKDLLAQARALSERLAAFAAQSPDNDDGIESGEAGDAPDAGGDQPVVIVPPEDR